MAEANANAVNDDLSTMLSKMTLIRLKKELKKRNLRTTGVKNELILRLLKVMQVEHGQGEFRGYESTQSGDDEEEQEDGSESDEGSNDDDNYEELNEELERSNRQRADTGDKSSGRRNRPRELHNQLVANQLFTFRDIKESMDIFSGDDEADVTRWIKEFEEMARLCEWSDIQKVVYAKRLLCGSVKLFV